MLAVSTEVSYNLQRLDINRAANNTGCHGNASTTTTTSSLFACDAPHTPCMTSLRDRLLTYQGWRRQLTTPTPRQLARAGFFCLKSGDRLKCFYCDGGLQNWRENDDPWEEHAKWFPECEYLLQQKSFEFVHEISRRYPNLPRPIIRTASSRRTPPPPVTSSTTSSDHVPVVAPTVEERWRDFLETEVGKTVCDFGFDADLIETVVKRRLRQTDGEAHLTLRQIVEDVQREEARRDVTSHDVATSSTSQPDLDGETSNSYGGLRRGETSSCETSRNAADESERLESLRDEILCKVCLDRDCDVIFQPCNHLACCAECARSMPRCCPICRRAFDRVLKVHRA